MIEECENLQMLLGDKLSLIFWQAFNENIGEQTGESYKQIQRYIRLTFLQLILMGMVDCKGIAFNSEMEVSNLSMEEQPKAGMLTLNALTAAESAATPGAGDPSSTTQRRKRS